MRPGISHLPKVMPRSFDDLNALHPLRPMRDAIDLENAEEVMDRLAVLDKRTKDQNDYLETLVLLAEAYDAAAVEDALDGARSAGVDALKYLMEIHGMKQTDLVRVLKLGASGVSMLLSGARPITADHARRLAKHFDLSPAAFL